jgi:hypothetical protein
MPYNDIRTNHLAIGGQAILVFSYFASILLKVDTDGEVLTDDLVGALMVAVNIPMALYFLYDVREDVFGVYTGAKKSLQDMKDNGKRFTNPLNDKVDEE